MMCVIFQGKSFKYDNEKEKNKKNKSPALEPAGSTSTFPTHRGREQLQQGSSCSPWSLVRGFSVFSVQAHECSKVKMDCSIRLGDCVQKNYSDYLLCDQFKAKSFLKINLALFCNTEYERRAVSTQGPVVQHFGLWYKELNSQLSSSKMKITA